MKDVKTAMDIAHKNMFESDVDISKLPLDLKEAYKIAWMKELVKINKPLWFYNFGHHTNVAKEILTETEFTKFQVNYAKFRKEAERLF